MSDGTTDTFACAECGCIVHLFGAPAAADDAGSRRCLDCRWIARNVPPQHQDEVRRQIAWINGPGT